MTTDSHQSYAFKDYLIVGAFSGLTIGNLAGLFVSIIRPLFLDTLPDLFIFCWAIPCIVGIITGSICFLLRRIASSRNFPFLKVPLFFSNRKLLGAIASGLFVISLILFASQSDDRGFKVRARVFILGIDAGTWSVINPLIDNGRLAHFAELKRTGSYANLKSIEPTISPILWTTIATGKNSAKHGIHDFYSTRASLRSMRLWDMFAARGMRIGVFRWWITWPPDAVNGFVIPDILARDDRTYPPEYSAINALRIAEKSGYSRKIAEYIRLTWSLTKMGLRMSTLRSIGWEFTMDWLKGGDTLTRYAIRRRAELRINKDVFVYLLRKYQPEFIAFYDNGVDMLSHKYWKYYEPTHFSGVNPSEVKRYGSIIPEYYELMDHILAELESHFDEQTLMVVLSDHGMQALSTPGEGYYNPKLSKILKLLDLDSIVYQIALGKKFYIRLKDPNKMKALDEAEQRIKSIKVVETGKALFDITRDDVGLVVKTKRATADFSYHAQIGQRIVDLEEIIYKLPPYTGTHRIDGILLAKGPHVRQGVEISEASILDITPTILYLEKMPISNQIDGKILYQAISDDFQKVNVAQFVPESPFNETQNGKKVEFDEQTQERLKSLGYIQ